MLLIRRIIIIILVIAGIGAAVWWYTRPKPVAVALVEVGQGKVEASVANTRAGSVEACQRTRLSPISGGRIAYLGVKKVTTLKKGKFYCAFGTMTSRRKATLRKHR